MFTYSIDKKPKITDPNGNELLDLTSNMFSRNAGSIKDYNIVKLTEHYQMRPDLVSLSMYSSTEYAEFILKFSGISNPFVLDKDDVMLIPNENQMEGMAAVNDQTYQSTTSDGVLTQIRNYYKFVNQEYKSNSASYDKLAKMEIPSGVINVAEQQQKEYMVPYISTDGRAAVTIRGNRLYFGEDSNVPVANNVNVSPESVTSSVQSIINQAITSLSDTNCLYNGTSLADFTRATLEKSLKK